jgi:Tfp pilus assembly protein PilO
MKASPATTQLRIAWLAVALAALLGYVTAIAPAQQRIASIESHAAELADLAARNEVLVQRLGALEQTRARVRDDLRRLGGKGDAGRVAVALLQVLQGEAARNHLTISSIAPASEEPAAHASGGEEDVAVTLRGRYRDVMAAIADVPHHDVLVEVRSVRLARVASREMLPSVDATIQAALYHDVTDLVREEPHVRAAAQ